MEQTTWQHNDHGDDRGLAEQRPTSHQKPSRVLSSILIAVFAMNQFLMIGIAEDLGAAPLMTRITHFMGARDAQAMEILMPIPNADGKTTHLQMMPTITAVAGEPNTGDAVADAMTVMIATGAPFYAPAG